MTRQDVIEEFRETALSFVRDERQRVQEEKTRSLSDLPPARPDLLKSLRLPIVSQWEQTSHAHLWGQSRSKLPWYLSLNREESRRLRVDMDTGIQVKLLLDYQVD